MASLRTTCHWFVSVVRDPAGQHNLPRVIVSMIGSRSSVAGVEAFLMFTDDHRNYEARRNSSSLVGSTIGVDVR